MLFSSYEFIFLFLPVVITLFFKFSQKSNELAILWLVISSLFFYGWWNYKYVVLIIISIIFNYSAGYLISKNKYAKNIHKKTIFTFGIIFNLGLLGYFKYADFFIENINYIFGSHILLLNIMLPLAISFFTFQQIAFLVDSYRQETKEYSFIHYCLFVCFFPQLIAGPIVHHKEILPQFSKKKTYLFDLKNFQMGISIFAIGLFKKVIIADNIAQYATPVFSKALHNPIQLFDAWGAALAYTFQLYFDFSGYADMAIGAALMMNIMLPINFNSPYKSKSIIDFWRTWHITLSRFLRDYLYIPLGGSRHGSFRRYRNLFITMLLGGIWHGAGWTFLVWGALHGFYLTINHIWVKLYQRYKLLNKIQHSRLWLLFAWNITFISVVVGWVLFRAESFSAAQNILTGMVGGNGIAFPDSIATRIPYLKIFLASWNVDLITGIGKTFILNYLWVLFAAFIAIFLPNSHDLMKYQKTQKQHSIINIKWSPNAFWAMIIGLIFGLSILGLSRVGEFIYFQF